MLRPPFCGGRCYLRPMLPHAAITCTPICPFEVETVMGLDLRCELGRCELADMLAWIYDVPFSAV
jgi:hypothetical protein